MTPDVQPSYSNRDFLYSAQRIPRQAEAQLSLRVVQLLSFFTHSHLSQSLMTYSQ